MSTQPFNGIEIFLAIVRLGSLRSAAKSLGMGAPAVSYRLKALERELGVNLLVRTTRSIELTDAGRALVNRAGPAFAQIDEAIAEAREAGRAKTGTLRLTLPWSAYRIAIEPVLAEFQAHIPMSGWNCRLMRPWLILSATGFMPGSGWVTGWPTAWWRHG